MRQENGVFVHIVTYNHEKYIKRCIEGVLNQSGFEHGENLKVQITDNNSSDNTLQRLEGLSLDIVKNSENLGFCLAHNTTMKKFLESKFDFYLCLNPDLFLESQALKNLVSVISNVAGVGCVCPKLLRADDNLDPLVPRVIDCAGIYMTESLRHFDRGAGEPDNGQYDKQCEVFGGSGACILMSKDYINDLEVEQLEYRDVLTEVFPQYTSADSERKELFDEAFFAYREDADLAWRSRLFGWKCMYVPAALGYHVRKVTPEKRPNLSAEINLHGVKNRFLLQLNNYSLSYGLRVFVKGYIVRNLTVILAVVLKERSSIKGLLDCLKFMRRALERRRKIQKRSRVSAREVAFWFNNKES